MRELRVYLDDKASDDKYYEAFAVDDVPHVDERGLLRIASAVGGETLALFPEGRWSYVMIGRFDDDKDDDE